MTSTESRNFIVKPVLLLRTPTAAPFTSNWPSTVRPSRLKSLRLQPVRMICSVSAGEPRNLVLTPLSAKVGSE